MAHAGIVIQTDQTHAGFPLTPHANGQWRKKIRGKIRVFGTWNDPMGAGANYNVQAADLHAGRPSAFHHGLIAYSQLMSAGRLAPLKHR